MIPPLYDYQKNIIAEDKKHTGIFLGTGVGKTRVALELAEGSILIICPKQQFLEDMWQNSAKKFGITNQIKTVSKEWFRAHWEELGAFDTVIIDEAHNNLGVLPETRQRNKIEIPKTSQLFEATLLYLHKYPPKRLYLCTATPVTKPMNMWAIAKLYGHNWDFFRFRKKYYFLTVIGRRQVWLPRKDQETLTRLSELVKRFGYVGHMSDFVEVPEQTHLMPPDIAYIELTDEQKHAIKQLSQEEADPLVRRARQRTIENGVLYSKKIEALSDIEDILVKDTIIFPSRKIDYILERALEFDKMLIFANYTAQINEIVSALKKEGYTVETLTGQTKDRGEVLKRADALPKCIVVAQSSISEGYQLPSIPCVIYASKSWQHRHYEQSLGRVLRRDNLKKNLYIHLIVKGGPDEDCHKSIMAGADFQEKLSIN